MARTVWQVKAYGNTTKLSPLPSSCYGKRNRCNSFYTFFTFTFGYLIPTLFNKKRSEKSHCPDTWEILVNTAAPVETTMGGLWFDWVESSLRSDSHWTKSKYGGCWRMHFAFSVYPGCVLFKPVFEQKNALSGVFFNSNNGEWSYLRRRHYSKLKGFTIVLKMLEIERLKSTVRLTVVKILSLNSSSRKNRTCNWFYVQHLRFFVEIETRNIVLL